MKKTIFMLMAGTFFLTAAKMPAVKAQEPGDNRLNLALNSPVSEAIVKGIGPETYPVPEELRSDTLSAVTDGLRYPGKPHTGNGANPYAWTNYNAALAGHEVADVILNLYDNTYFQEIVLYHFVDSWSADLPEAVHFYTQNRIYDGNMHEENFVESYLETELLDVTKMSDTCYKCRYRVEGGLYAQCTRLVIRMISQTGSKHRRKCVGLYEVEIYEQQERYGSSEDVIFSADMIDKVEAGSEELSKNCGKENAIDGDPATRWHTAWSGCDPEDRYIALWLKDYRMVSGIRYEARYGAKNGDNNGRIRNYGVYGTRDGLDWFYIGGGSLPDKGGVHEIRFDATLLKAIKLQGTSTYGNVENKFMSAAEVSLYGR